MNEKLVESPTVRINVEARSTDASQSDDPDRLAELLRNAFERRDEIPFLRADEKIWVIALDRLIRHRMLDVATYAAPRLAKVFTHTRFFQTMAGVFDRLPSASDDRQFSAFCDDPAQNVQIVQHGKADTVLLAFCGGRGKMDIPLNLIHRWFGQLGVHVIYLRNSTGRNFDGGIGVLAPDLRGTLLALEKAIDALGGKRAVCYGNSLGGYGALRYGLELRGEAVLSLAGPTNLDRNFWGFSALRQIVAPGMDLRGLYEHARNKPKVHLVYSERNALDRAQAFNFADLPGVTLEPVQGVSGHPVFLNLLFRDRYERLIHWLVDPNRGTAGP